MKAVVYRGAGDIGLDDVPEPTIQGPTGSALEPSEHFDRREPGRIELALDPARAA